MENSNIKFSVGADMIKKYFQQKKECSKKLVCTLNIHKSSGILSKRPKKEVGKSYG